VVASFRLSELNLGCLFEHLLRECDEILLPNTLDSLHLLLLDLLLVVLIVQLVRQKRCLVLEILLLGREHVGSVSLHDREVCIAQAFHFLQELIRPFGM